MSIIPSVLYYFQHVPLTRIYLMSHISGLILLSSLANVLLTLPDYHIIILLLRYVTTHSNEPATI